MSSVKMKPIQSLVFVPGLFSAISGQAPGQNWEKMIDLTSKLGEIYDIEHSKGSKIYHYRLYCGKHTT